MFLTITLNANEYYLLPEHKSDLLHTLKQKIARARTITFICSELESQPLAQSIEKALLKGSEFHLITTSLESAAYYAKYKNTLVKVPRSEGINEAFSLNMLIIDRSDICFSTLAFSEALLKRHIGSVICTTDEEDIAFGERVEKSFVERFEAYEQ
ncbi:hypothetical protein [Sulfurimonas sp. HSL3-7]|uniref:hypothetical protein n=1 Tax=Sulfonitrofixus jiaomeiensis TaxID=3131938 RepID=UPI0031F73E1C